MNRFLVIFILFFHLSNCSFNDSSSLWSEKEDKLETTNTKKIFHEKNSVDKELNINLKLDLSGIKINKKTDFNQNNYGSQVYAGKLDKIGNYKFTKLDKQNYINSRPVFLKDGIIFFDKKGSIIKYDKNHKIVWKKNYYSKSEKKLQPKIYFVSNERSLFVVDSLAKYYSLNLKTGELNWSKNNIYPFNSEIKIYKDKIFVVDYENTLRCFRIKDGSEVWSLKTDKSFTISNSKYSLIIVDNNIVFSNSIGDITSADINTGLIKWQLPTQSSIIKSKSYNLNLSKLISDSNSIFFSINRNEFYSIDINTGTINWINKINSNIDPLIIGNLIITVSSQGYLYLLEKNTGNIIRVTDLFKNYSNKQKEEIFPVGFVVGAKNLYLTVTNGNMIIARLDTGEIIKIKEIAKSMVSSPFIFNNNLYLIKNGSIIQYN